MLDVYKRQPFIFLYNMVAAIMRALGDSKTPLYFLILTSALNIGLDLLFVIPFKFGVFGAALATDISQVISGVLSLSLIHIFTLAQAAAAVTVCLPFWASRSRSPMRISGCCCKGNRTRPARSSTIKNVSRFVEGRTYAAPTRR